MREIRDAFFGLLASFGAREEAVVSADLLELNGADGDWASDSLCEMGVIKIGPTIKSVLRESHPRQWVDGSSPAYTGSKPGIPVFLSFSLLAARGER